MIANSARKIVRSGKLRGSATLALSATSLLLLTLTSSILLALALGCDRNTEAFVEGEQPRQPDLARIFPESDGAQQRPGVGAPMGGGVQRGNVPPGGGQGPAQIPQRGAPPVVAQTSDGGSGTISGTISVAPELESGVSAKAAQGMLYVIARPFGVNAGPPTAVLRVPSPSFPFRFEIGPNNVMIPSMRFEGKLGITARLDGDGNAMTKLPGDLSGATPAPLEPGATDVEIVLDQKL